MEVHHPHHPYIKSGMNKTILSIAFFLFYIVTLKTTAIAQPYAR